MPIKIDDKLIPQLKQIAQHLISPVTLVFFDQNKPNDAATDQENLLIQLTQILGSKVHLNKYNLQTDPKAAQRYKVDKAPATIVLNTAEDRGLRFFGRTAGMEFAPLIDAILMVSTGTLTLEAETLALIKQLDKPVHIEVMVTHTCPYCSQMVQLAHQLAFASSKIEADMIDVSAFPDLVSHYHIASVPKTVINRIHAFDGAVSAFALMMEVLKISNPREFEAIESSLRRMSGERKALEILEGNLYDVMIIGAGPAAMSAALYAVRKNLSVALIGNEVGGQVAYTARIENWLGIPEITGLDLRGLFQRHMELYPIAEKLHTQIQHIEYFDDSFHVRTGDGSIYRSKTLIYCAGKRYRTLGIPGEDRFLGRGIAFCATCDAPLFQDKRVAVIGGGNSAFTAARDLLPFAREVHMIHHSSTFHADQKLIDEVRTHGNVHTHIPMETREFLGDDELSGLRLQSTSDPNRTLELTIEGAFEEIGLVANSAPVAELAKLNSRCEIEIDRDQASSFPGLFAAGDVTAGGDKQIIIAAGAGAQAALSAHRYLLNLADKIQNK